SQPGAGPRRCRRSGPRRSGGPSSASYREPALRWSSAHSLLSAWLRALLVQPRHARAQRGADLLDRVLQVLAHELVVDRLAGLVLLDPRAGELALLDVLEDAAHLLLGAVVHDARPARQV